MNPRCLCIALLLLLAGSFSCSEEEDIDMSQIDFSNIAELYKQPLPVIQKCVQGKWKVYSQCGGIAGCDYPENDFVEITSDEFIIDADNDYFVHSYSWIEKNIQEEGETITTYVMCLDDGADQVNQAGRIFESIKNGRLNYRSCALTSDYSVFGTAIVRVK
jgi:hypothetical protein